MDKRLIWAYFMRVKLLVFIFSSWQKERDVFMRFRKNFFSHFLGSNHNVPSVTMGALFGADNAGSPLYSVTVIDWVIIRKYIANEPLQVAWGTEES
jgi:hypothetical protein